MINQDKYHAKLQEAEDITLLARAKELGHEPIMPTEAPVRDPSIDIYVAENAKLSKELEKLSAENAKLRDALEEATAKYADAMRQGEQLMDDCDELKGRLEDREGVIATLQNDNKKLKKALEQLTST